MESSSMVPAVIQSVEDIVQVISELPSNGTRCRELGERFNGFLDLFRSWKHLPAEALEDATPTLEKISSLLKSVGKFLKSAADLIGEGIEDGLDATILVFVRKVEAIVMEVQAIDKHRETKTSPSEQAASFEELLEHQYVEDPPMDDPYDDRSVISQAAFGATHRMKHTTHGRSYAVKRLRFASLTTQGVTFGVLTEECKTLKRLAHPHIVRYTATFLSKGDRFFNIAMELIEGGRSLAQKVTCTPAETPTEAEIVAWARQMASALSYMHGEGVLHRDLKPENVMLTEAGSIKIVDVQLACIASAAKKTALSVYSSYERVNGLPYDGRDDVWAVGCILLELLTRERLLGQTCHPTDSERRYLLLSAAAAAFPRLGGEILPHLLSPLQEHRYTAQALLDALEVLLRRTLSEAEGEEEEAEWINDPVMPPPPEEEGETEWINDPVLPSSPEEGDEPDWINDPVLPSSAQVDVAHTEGSNVESETSIASLVQLLRCGTKSSKQAVVERLAQLVQTKEDRVALGAAGDLALWMELLSEGTENAKILSAHAFRNLIVADADKRKEIASAGAIPFLVQMLVEGSDRAKEAAAVALNNLSVDSAENEKLIAEAGAITPLVQLLSEGTGNARNYAAGVIRHISFEDNIESVVAAGAIPPLVKLLETGINSAKEEAAAALWILTVNAENKKTIAAAGAIPLLVQLLVESSDKEKERAAGALGSLAQDVHNQKTIAAAGAIPLLVQLLSEGTDVVKEQAAGALWNLAFDVHNQKTIAAAGAIPLLVQLLREGTDGAKENAAGALGSLAVNNPENSKKIGVAGAIPLLVQLLLKDGMEDAQRLAVFALWELSRDTQNRDLIAEAGAIPLLVERVREGTVNALKETIYALWKLSATLPHGERVVSAGAVPPLVLLLREGAPEIKEVAAGALHTLACNEVNRNSIVAAGAIPPLVQLLREGTDGAKETAAGALGNLAVDDNVEEVITEAGAIPPLVQLLREGTVEAKELAASALWNLVCQSKPGKIALKAEKPTEALKWLEQHGTAGAKDNAKKLLKRLSGVITFRL